MRRIRFSPANIVVIATAFLLSSCISPTPSGPGGGNGGGGDSSYLAMLNRHNNTRDDRGLSDLVPNERLDDIAQDQAEYMAGTGNLTHEDQNGDHVDDRADNAGYNWVRIGENVGFAGSAADVYELWLESSSHYANITSPQYREIGIGRADRGSSKYWCVVFGDR